MIKYKYENACNKDGKKPYVQMFDGIQIQYKLDEENRILVPVGVIDVQEMVNSNYESSLDYILNQYLSNGGTFEDLYENVTFIDDEEVVGEVVDTDLADLGDVYERAAYYKEHYSKELNIPDNASVEDVLKIIGNKALELKYKVAALKNNIEKEVKEDETKNFEESK